ncbi:MAG: ABC transporter permease [Verrucomicrobiales bacterium]|nr:ABC transporter permease [Verrucomicrobiales bacterium]
MGYREKGTKEKSQMNAIARLGGISTRFIAWFGSVALLVVDALKLIATGKVRWREALHHIVAIGFGSQVVVMITGAFTGAVFAVQAYMKFHEIGLGSATGPVVSVAMCRELGPVLAALMVTGRMGASMAAELGTMRVTDQIDALRVMGVNPIEYLVVPRLLAITISMPVLVAEAIVLGILAAGVLTVGIFHMPGAWYEGQVVAHTGLTDFAVGLIKGAVFGVLIVFICCREGLAARHGAVGVGIATTHSVVHTSLAVLVSNLLLTMVLNQLLPIVTIGF